MKRVLSLLLVLILAMGVLAGCSSNEPATPAEPSQPEAPVEEPAEEPTETPAEGGQKLGLGHVISMAKSRDAGTDANGNPVLAQAQVDVTAGSVLFDSEGKVLSVFIDVAQTRVAFDADMAVTTDKTVEAKTKKDLGPDYGMARASGIQKEWFEQIAALEDWMVGKTVDEIKGMGLEEGKTTEEDLVSSVTITVTDYIAVVEQAWAEAIEAEGAVKAGLGVKTSIAKSRDAGTDANGNPVLAQAQVDTVLSAVAFDADDNVAGAVIDTAQVRVAFDEEGVVTTDRAGEFKTKNELAGDYGMLRASGIQKEWFEQAEALATWMVGKSVAEITGMGLEEGKTTEEDLVSSVTVTVTDYLDVVAEAFEVSK